MAAKDRTQEVASSSLASSTNESPVKRCVFSTVLDAVVIVVDCWASELGISWPRPHSSWLLSTILRLTLSWMGGGPASSDCARRLCAPESLPAAASGPRRAVADIVEQRVRRIAKNRADPQFTTKSMHILGDRRQQLIVAAL